MEKFEFVLDRIAVLMFEIYSSEFKLLSLKVKNESTTTLPFTICLIVTETKF